MTNRNDPCPCGSGKKFKKCCMGKGTPGPGPVSAPARAATKEPGDEELLRAGDRLWGQSDLAGAVKAFETVLTRRPRQPQALYALATINAHLQRHEAALELFGKASAAKNRWAEPVVGEADVLLSMGRAEEGLARAREAIRLQADVPRGHLVAARCLNRLNRVDDALKMLRQAPRRETDAHELVVVRSELHRRSGALEEARVILEQCIEERGLRPDMHQVLKERALVLDRIGAYDEAFDSAERGGLMQAATPRATQIDREFWFDRIDDYRTLLTHEQLAHWTAEPFDDGHPVPAFLVGFPRSGTTMTEQIMAAHPDVTTFDERPFIKERCEALCRQTESVTMGQALLRVDREQVRSLRAAYWKSVEDMVGEAVGSRVFVDKLPLNIIDLGVINTLFPEARIIVALRDPRDVCLSCFMQRFGLNSAMVNFLWWERTAEFYAKVMEFWGWLREVITLPWITVRYEDTVTDLEASARRILATLDLPWDDAVLSFHERAKQRALTTPSFVAVTEQVHTKAVGRWHNYARHYEAVGEHLAPFIESFGYLDV